MGHGHNNLNEMPSGVRNWGVTIAGALVIGILFLFVGTSWKGPGADNCCEKDGHACKMEAGHGHGDAACCKGDAKAAHGDAKAACDHKCGEACEKAGKCTHACTAECKHGDAKAACDHKCGEACEKAGKCTHECTAECKHTGASHQEAPKSAEPKPAGH